MASNIDFSKIFEILEKQVLTNEDFDELERMLRGIRDLVASLLAAHSQKRIKSPADVERFVRRYVFKRAKSKLGGLVRTEAGGTTSAPAGAGGGGGPPPDNTPPYSNEDSPDPPPDSEPSDKKGRDGERTKKKASRKLGSFLERVGEQDEYGDDYSRSGRMRRRGRHKIMEQLGTVESGLVGKDSNKLGGLGEALGGIGKLGKMLGGAAGEGALGAVGGVVGVIGLFGKAVLGSLEHLRDWGENLHQANMQFAKYSGAMAGVGARQEVRDIMLSIERGGRRAESAEQLAEGKHRLNKALAPIEDALANLKNKVVAGLSNFTSSLIEKFQLTSKGSWALGPQRGFNIDIDQNLGRQLTEAEEKWKAGTLKTKSWLGGEKAATKSEYDNLITELKKQIEAFEKSGGVVENVELAKDILKDAADWNNWTGRYGRPKDF